MGVSPVHSLFLPSAFCLPFWMRGPRAILFDMDGTLTRPYLDFPRMKQEMGIPLERPILEALAEMEPVERRRAESILYRHEEIAAAGSALNEGCDELMGMLRNL